MNARIGTLAAIAAMLSWQSGIAANEAQAGSWKVDFTVAEVPAVREVEPMREIAAVREVRAVREVSPVPDVPAVAGVPEIK